MSADYPYMDGVPVTTNKFKDTQGRWRTGSLFWERGYDPDFALFSMKGEDHAEKGLPSFARLYLEICDPTEYRVATEILGGWEHWQVLNSSKWFQEFIEPLRAEVDIKLRSEALLQVVMKMGSEGGQALNAAKMLLEGKHKPKRGKGRPSNAEVKEEARRLAEVEKRVSNDAERMGLTLAVDNEE